MMNKQEFYKNIEESIIGFLPEQYATAQITLTTRVKNYDEEQTGIVVRMPKENAAPIIYLDAYFRQYEEGRGIEDILQEIAQIRDRAMDGPVSMVNSDFLSDYENVRPRLQMRIYDTEWNEKRLSEIVHHSYGDYSEAYGVLLSEDKDHFMTVMVTPALMETWGITKKKLHDDTILADLSRGPQLVLMSDVMDSMFGGSEPVNYLEGMGSPMDELPEGAEKLFVLTNKDKVNGAGLILNSVIQEKIANIVGGNYYVLPSSVHEVLIMPDKHDRELMGAKQLGEMVSSINESTVAPEDLLSNRVEYYDAANRTLCNAAQYEKEHEQVLGIPKAKTI